MRTKILAGGILFALLLALILSYNNYQRFTAMITQDHQSDALRTAQTALTFLDADNFSAYSEDTFETQEILQKRQNLADTQDAMFIYVIELFNDYNEICFGINVKKGDSDFDIVPIGFVMPTSSDEYKNAYRKLYEGVTDYAFVIRDNGISLTGDHVTAMLPIKTSDGEVKNILCVQWQMANLTKVTAEKERIATELEVATQIQSSMLPKNFSVDNRVDIFATMTPAKEVGGDLYDFYKLDENNLFVTIADVSGKGVPAALFMVAAITNLRNFTASLKNPDDLKTAIEKTNDRLCANNNGGLFVTAFSGVLDLTTGIFRYVNAGHNPPLIHRRGKNFEELPMELNFVLGGWEDWNYIQQEIQLEPGDTIFSYTDGVTEAADSTGKFYSLERLKNFLNEIDNGKSAEEILSAVSESLENFSDDAEQSDDITMLAVKFERSNENVANQQRSN